MEYLNNHCPLRGINQTNKERDKTMKNIISHTGTLHVIERLESSSNGNPRYRAEVGGVSFVTAVDSSMGYAITNWEGKAVTITAGLHYGRLTLDTLKGEEKNGDS